MIKNRLKYILSCKIVTCCNDNDHYIKKKILYDNISFMIEQSDGLIK